MMVFTQCLYGQITVNGTLTNANTGEELIGATILEKGTENGTITDIDGRWSLTVPDAQTVLELNYLGFESKEVIAGNGQTALNLTLLQNGEILEDIVITALGLERSTARLGYNVQQLDGDELADVQSVNLVQNLAGKLFKKWTSVMALWISIPTISQPYQCLRDQVQQRYTERELLINDNITYSWGPELDQGTLIPQFDSPVTLANGETVRGGDVAVHGGVTIPGTPFVSHADNLSSFYRTGSTLTNHLALTGGNDKGSYRIALSNMQNESIIPGTNLDRNAVISRLSFDLTDNWKINSTLNYTRTSSDNRPSGGYGSENINYSLVAWGPRSLDTEILRDYWQPGLEGLQQYSFNYTFFDNPYFILQENTNSFVRDRIMEHMQSTQ